MSGRCVECGKVLHHTSLVIFPCDECKSKGVKIGELISFFQMMGHLCFLAKAEFRRERSLCPICETIRRIIGEYTVEE